MALTTFALQNVPLNADILRDAVSSLVPNGGGLVQTGDLAVTQTATASMNVQIGVGRVWFPGTNLGNIAGQTYSKQGQYFGINDATVTKAIGTPDPTNPRIDVIYVYAADQAYLGTINTGDFGVLPGTPNASPVAPTNLPANAMALANVAVAANAPSITTANITQLAKTGVGTSMQPKGLLFKNVDTGNSGSIGTAIAVVYNIPTFTFKAGRHYRIRWDFEYQGTTAGNYIIASVQSASTADAAGATTGLTQLKGKPWKVNDASSISQPAYVDAYYSPVADSTIQIKFCLSVAVGSGTILKTQTATSPGYFTVEDLGAQY